MGFVSHPLGPLTMDKRGQNRLAFILCAVAGIIPLWFALYTGQAFEDFFIALRHSVLLVEGHGLTYEAGQRIQGFSSPLAVLLGAAAYALTGADSAWSALWLLRALGIAAYCTSAYCMIQSFLLGRRETRSPWPWILLLGLFAFESKSVAFAINGMETPFFVLFLSGAIWSLGGTTRRHAIWLGLCWGGMMWTRPDGAFYILFMSIATLVFPDRERKDHLRDIAIAAGVCVYWIKLRPQAETNGPRTTARVV